jgi:glutamine synthetase
VEIPKESAFSQKQTWAASQFAIIIPSVVLPSVEIRIRKAGEVAGKLAFDELKQAVAEGMIDTVLAVFTDMQGRLMGKRMHADFFVDTAWEGTHCCNYLLATDMEMETVEGYKSTSWEAGYGDYAMKPDLDTIRLIPWLDGTALVMCDLLDHHTHQEIPHSPRAILKKQTARLNAMGMKAFIGSPLEFSTAMSAPFSPLRMTRMTSSSLVDWKMW